MRCRSSVAIAVWCAGLLCAGLSSPVHAAKNGLAQTPPMGWNSWNKFGCSITEAKVKAIADELASPGLSDQGYQYVTVDDCWMASQRDAGGNLVADPVRFPSGMKALADYVHSKGLKFGLYQSPTQGTCQLRPGSYEHETQDANTFAAWGVDYLKYDWCQTSKTESPKMWADFPGRSEKEIAQILFRRMSDALRATGRPIVYSLSACCSPLEFSTWAGDSSNLWRTSGDIADTWPSVLSNYRAAIDLQAAAGPGGWNDPDMLEVGNGGLSGIEYRSHMSLWAMLAAPLVLGNDVTTSTAETEWIVGNPAIIAIDQDSLGVAATRIANASGLEVLTRPLANGDRAVALLNTGASTATISTTLTKIGLPAASATLTDVWSGAVTSTAGTISASVPAHGTAIYRVRSSTPPAAGATEFVGVASGLCIDVNSGQPTDGNALIIYGCHGMANQQFAVGNGALVTFGGLKCVRPRAGSLARGTVLEVGPCTGGTEQAFARTPTGALRHTASGMCVDVKDARTSSGTGIILWDCHGATNQQWLRR